MAEELTPRQAEILVLLDPGGDRPNFKQDIADLLLDRLESEVAELGGFVDSGDPLYVGKSALTEIQQCEGLWLAAGEFEWTIEAAVGRMADKAIERSALSSRADRSPMDWVDVAMESLGREETSFGQFLASMDPDDLDELRIRTSNQVTTFRLDWPSIDRRWLPRAKPRLRVELVGGRVVLSGLPDLMFGQPSGTTARVAIFDVKTGSRHFSHREEARFYALLETLARKVPPYLAGTYYTSSGEIESETITEDLLFATADTVAGSVRRMFEIKYQNGRPVLRSGPPCKRCLSRRDCDIGSNYLKRHVA